MNRLVKCAAAVTLVALVAYVILLALQGQFIP